MHRLGGLAALIVVVSVPLSSVPPRRRPGGGPRARAIERPRRKVARVRPRGDRDRPALDRLCRVSARRRVVGGPVPRDGDHAGLARAVHDRTRMGARVGARPHRGAGRSSDSRGLAGLVPSTPDGGFEAEVVALAAFSPDALPPRDALQGRIVLLPDGDPPWRFRHARHERGAVSRSRLRAAGVVAILSADSDPDNELSARGFEFSTAISRAAGRAGRPRRCGGDPQRTCSRLRADVARADQPDHSGRRHGQQRDRRPPGPRSSRRMGASSARISTPGTSEPARRTTPPASPWCSRRPARSRRSDRRRGGRSGLRCGAAKSRGSSARPRTPARMRPSSIAWSRR